MLLLLVACSSGGQVAESELEPSLTGDNEIVYALALQPASFDHHVARSPQVGIVLRQVYDTLVYREQRTGAFIPGLAVDWSVSADGLEYTFLLREGVTFHDGTRFDAIAVGVNLERILELDGYAAALLGPYAGYEIVDGQTIRIRMTEPYAPLLDVMSQYYFGMASPLALSEVSTPRYQFHHVGTGPYRYVDFIPGQFVRLELNENYTGGGSIYDVESRNPPERIEFIFEDDPQLRADALATGEVDIAGQLSPSAARSLAVNANVQVVPVPIAGQTNMFLMNTQTFPTDSAIVRQALLFGTNRAEIQDSIFEGFVQPAWGPISGGTLFYSRELTGAFDYDIQQARDLLESAGYEDTNEDGIFELDEVDLTVTLLVQPGGRFEEIARMLVDQWRIIGVGAVVEFRPTQSSLEVAVAEGAYNLVSVSNSGVDPFFLADYLASDSPLNWIGVSDPALDDVVRASIQAQDINIRATAFVQMQRYMMNEALILPITEVVVVNGVRTGITALPYDVYGWYPLMYNMALV
ncbi:MAG: ABC transporter substrate-binding protein, partial [Chloroflexota bacterium]